MNDLERYFYNNTGRVIYKWRHYFEIYERHLARYRGQAFTLLEVGVWKGGSLQMWKHYFGPHVRIYGVDTNPACQEYQEAQIEVLLGDQEDRAFWRSVKQRIPTFDVVIDDGGHTMRQQIVTFEEVFPHMAADGVYLCEDLHTSYWEEYGGGYRNPASFIEYSKNLIDHLHGWHARAARRTWYGGKQPQLEVSDFTRSTHSLHFYDSVLVIEKRKMERPSDLQTGVDAQ